MGKFNYYEAFSRNIGWLTEEEQQVLKNKRVAIAGMGGVGGLYLITLIRLGIEKFHIADFDTFEIQNFNRQYGANMSSLNRLKTDTMIEYARQINPNVEIESFNEGVTEENVEKFLEDVDLYADGIDIFAMNARQTVFKICEKLSIPGITIAPLGMGAAMGTYLPGGMSFEEYFQFDGLDLTDKVIHLLAGLAPKMLHMGYLVDPSSINLAEKRGPSTINGCQFCAGVCGTEALKILLNRDHILSLPTTLQFDGYKNKMATSYRPWGNRNPLQRLLIRYIKAKIQ